MSSIVPPTSITPVRCPAKGCPWGAHGIPDKYTEARAWHLAAHRAEEHGKPLTAEQIAWAEAKGYRLPETQQNATPPAPLTPERAAEIVARAERRMEKCRKRGQASLADLESTKNDVLDLAEALDRVRAKRPTVALLSEWDCANGTAEDEPFCAENEDDDHACPTVRVHPDDAPAFAAMVDMAHELRVRLAELEAQAAAATEYRVPAPNGPALYVRRALDGDVWAVLAARTGREGRRAWTRDGWQLFAILAHSELHCWPDAATALAEARKALGAEGGAA